MEILSYCYCITFSCALLFPYLLCKPVSLNDIIAAEKESTSLQKPELVTSETKTNTRELPKNYKVITLTKHMTSGSIVPTNKKVSPLRYKKTFQIRAPLKPKKIKYSYAPRSKRVNTTTKREIDNNEKFNRNYIPFLKSLSMLFNNLLRSDSGDDDDTEKYYNKQKSLSKSEECPCAHNSAYKATTRESSKKAVAGTSSFTSAVPTKTPTIVFAETSTTSAYNPFDDNIGTLRRHKNIPILPTRNPISSWRNDNGLSQGSITTYYRNFEGHIAGNNGSDENNNSGRKATETSTENYKQYTDDSSGDDGSCNGSCRAIGGNRRITSNSTFETATFEAIVKSNETFRNYRRDSDQFKGFDKFETRRNKTESRTLLSQSSTRLRGFESQEETTEILWQIESPKEGSFDVTYNFTSNQRFFNGDGSMAPKNKEIRRANQKLILDDLTTNLRNAARSNLTKDKQKFVVIYDGYSVARDVNGDNKLTEKGYRIHS